ncbi:phosphomannomutase/phosphoglucomutase [Candidatus Pacebacteria bacterium]|nr:phosphomannomutase/phosphoglucomutase [Candidatus Paceibacterota bacterium]
MSFDHLNSIYRNYDIRGKYPDKITEDEVRGIGRAVVDLYDAESVVIGFDHRPSTSSLTEALIEGITMQGAHVINLGLVTTPMLYLGSGSTDAKVAIMITASHMPSEFNGLKICIEDSVPLGLDSGLSEIRDYVKKGTFQSTNNKGNVTKMDIKPMWRAKITEFVTLSPEKTTKVVIDPANTVGILEIDTLKQYNDALYVTSIFDVLDYTCPNHEANPMKLETLKDLSEEVVKTESAIGIALDGDADRIGIVDEAGTPVPQDMIGVLVAEELLRRHGENVIMHDVRSSKRVNEVVKKAGGKAIPVQIGHTYIRRRMREHNALFALELSGHHFFRDMHFSEGGILPALLIIEMMRKDNKKLSELVAEHKIYEHSGEINSEVTKTAEEIYTHLKEAFPNAEVETIDGLTLTYDDWWCNVRPSANDPVMRLNLEADTKDLMESKIKKVLKIIRG